MAAVLRNQVGIVLVVLALFAATSTPAIADDDPDEGALKEARELYEVGNAHYAAARYEKAAKAFAKGYKLSKLPGFLYNLANAYERMGEYRKAAGKLEIYLESPKAKDVVSVRERVRRLLAAAEDREREIAKQEAREKEMRRLAKLRGEDTGREEAKFEEGPRSPTYLFVLGGGAAALATSGIFALLSQSAATSAASDCIGMVCDRKAESDLDRERSFAVAADVSLGIGVVVVGVGAYLYLKGPPRRRVEANSSNERDRDRDRDPDRDPDRDDDDDDEDEDEDEDRAETSLGWLPSIDLESGTIGISAVGRF